MTRKRRRLMVVLLAGRMLGSAAALILAAFEDNIVFFHSPSDIATKPEIGKDRRIRIGGLVKAGTVRKEADGVTVAFVVTDTAHDLAIAYRGILPDLFREGQGVVVEGRLQPDGVFRAEEVLAKHDETYMPPEVAEAIKKSGQWKGGAGAAPAPGGPAK